MAQVVPTEDKRPTGYNNLHISILAKISGSTEAAFVGDILKNDETFGKFTQPDILLVTNGTLPSEDFTVLSKTNPRKLDM